MKNSLLFCNISREFTTTTTLHRQIIYELKLTSGREFCGFNIVRELTITHSNDSAYFFEKFVRREAYKNEWNMYVKCEEDK